MSVFKVILVKRGMWRGANEEWSNGYHFSGTAPADRAGAEAFFTSLFNLEKNFYADTQRLVQAYFYENPEGNSTIGKDYRTLPATGLLGTATALSTGTTLSLEQSSIVKARCGYTSKGKPRYVMKYFHGIRANGADPDKVAWAAAGTLDPLLVQFTNGTLPGGAALCRPDGQVCETPVAHPLLTTRTLKRRGKRPPA